MIQESTLDVLNNLLDEGTTSKWKKGTVQISTAKGKESIQGYLKGNIAVHKASTSRKGWAITHAPSGLLAATGLVTKSVAVTIADEIINKFPEFAKSDAKQVKSVAKRQGRFIQQLIVTLKATVNKRKPSVKQIAQQDKFAGEAKINKKFYMSIGDKYTKLQNLFIRYSEQSGLSLQSEYASYGVSKEIKKQQEVFYKAFKDLRWLISKLDFGLRGLLNNKHRSKVTAATKAYVAAMVKLKKVGIDINKTVSVDKTYVVVYDYQVLKQSGKLGNSGPNNDGVLIVAKSKHEAEVEAGKQTDKNPTYLVATELK